VNYAAESATKITKSFSASSHDVAAKHSTRIDMVRYYTNTIRYIYVRSKVDEMASLV